MLIERVQKELSENRTQTAYRALRQEVDSRYQMVGNSAALQKVQDAIQKAAPSKATVLLQGESGVGKELVARTIHRNSPRSRERFVQVNCAAIPEELIESELFGHEKGSFTGATERQTGKFEQADHGTIFLDEVGDMSLKTQAKVLRVLQEGEVERLGSAKTATVDVRVIAATNKNLEEEIEKGNFREDLYFRLAVIPIYVPPLRERPEDIPMLIKHYLDTLSRENNQKPKRITPAAIDTMKRYRWRGNIRELRNTVERLIIMSAGEVIDVPDLPDVIRSEKATARPAAPGSSGAAAPPPAGGDAGTLRQFKESAERAYLVEKLREKRLEHLQDRRSHRHAAEQPLQEARAVRHPAGNGRIGMGQWRLVLDRDKAEAAQGSEPSSLKATFLSHGRKPPQSAWTIRPLPEP